MQGTGSLLNVITVPPGATRTQARIVIDGVRGAIFEYTTGGALVSSWARSAGTDPYGNTYPEGFSAGAGSSFTGTDFIINNSGAFFYSGTPAAGNLIGSIAATAGTDSHSNPYVAGVVEYSGATYVRMFGAEILMSLAGFISQISPVSTGLNIAPSPASLVVSASPATAATTALLEVQGTIAATSVAAVVGGAQETWHNFVYSNGWSAGANGAQYRITAQGDLQISAQFAPGTTTNGTVIATLPAGWRPTNGKAIACYGDGTAATGGNPYLFVNTTGTITVHWVTSTQTVIYCEGSIRLT